MKRFILLLLAFSSACFADDFTLKLRNVRLSEYVHVVMTDVFKKSFILDDDFLMSRDLVTVNLVNVSSDTILSNLKYILASRKYRISDVDGVFYVSKFDGTEIREYFSYRPKYRSADYLKELVGQLGFSAFSTNRPVDGEMITPDSVVKTGGINDLVSRKHFDALVFEGSLNQIERLKQLFVALDVPESEVVVKALIFEVRKEERSSSGITMAVGLLKSVTGLGIAFDTGGDALDGVRLLGSDFRAIWSALASDSNFRLLSSPVVRVKSGERARFVAGSDVPTLGAVSYQGESMVKSIEYQSSGVIFEVQPDITTDAVSLSVKQQISSFVRTETGVNESPTLVKREIDTVISVRDDEVIILGGLEESKAEDGREGLSFLPTWLRGSRKSDGRTEIILMLHVQRI